MENEKIVEQPQALQIGNGSLDEERVVQSSPNADNGSTFGKFKDATSLLAAYDSLQAEFTRKSQKLSEIQKKLDMFENRNVDGLAQENNKGSMDKSIDSVSTENNPQGESNKIDVDCEINALKEKNEKQIAWKLKVDDFFSRHADAREFSRDIGKILKDNPELRGIDSSLEIAYKLAKSSREHKPAEHLNDPKFVSDHVMKNENIKNQIIHEYLKSVKNTNSSPKLLGGETNMIYSVPNVKKPRTIEDASKIVSKMFGGNF